MVTTRFSTDSKRVEGGPGLDIERGMHPLVLKMQWNRQYYLVMNKLEKVALRSAKKRGKPLILVLNNVHLFNDDDDGKNMLLQLQQRAEAWAASGEQSVSWKRHPYLTMHLVGILTLVMSS